jgi:hypothetical protein
VYRRRSIWIPNVPESGIKGFDEIGDRAQNKTRLKDCCEKIVMCAKNL